MMVDRLDPDARRMLETLATLGAPDFADMTPRLARRAFSNGISRFGGPAEAVAGISDVTIACRSGARAMRIYRPLRQTADRPSAALLWLHGGGFVFGDIDSYDPLCRALANRAGMNVLSFEYRLAPEYPFPAASEDVDDAWQWLHAHAGDLNMAPDRLAIGGDSAGGTLAIGTALSALPDARPRALALAYPGTASDLSSASHQSFADGFLLTRRTIAWCYDHYRGPLQSMQHDPRLAPLTARRLAHLPPTVMLLAGCDPLHDEGLAFEQRLDEANVPVTLLDHPTMIHGFLSYPGAIPLAATALSAFGKALARIVDDDRRR